MDCPNERKRSISCYVVASATKATIAVANSGLCICLLQRYLDRIGTAGFEPATP
jgi:hypothetical protein